jgi:hypothetical protein
MAQIILIGICVVAIGGTTWWMERSIAAMRRREHVAKRLLIDKPGHRSPMFRQKQLDKSAA